MFLIVCAIKAASNRQVLLKQRGRFQAASLPSRVSVRPKVEPLPASKWTSPDPDDTLSDSSTAKGIDSYTGARIARKLEGYGNDRGKGDDYDGL